MHEMLIMLIHADTHLPALVDKLDDEEQRVPLHAQPEVLQPDDHRPQDVGLAQPLPEEPGRRHTFLSEICLLFVILESLSWR